MTTKPMPTLIVGNTGTPQANRANILTAMGWMDVTARFDRFAGRMLIDGLSDYGPILDDAAMRQLWLQIDTEVGLKVPKEYFWDVVTNAAEGNSFHPVLDYLDGLRWDGTSRLETWLIENAGATDTPFVRAVSRIVLIAAVRRVRQPGVKFDEMLVLESEQGKNKSSALAVLAVKEEWFTDDVPLGSDSKQVIERLSGHWIGEAAELKGMRKSAIEHLKAFLSRRRDKARLAYGRLTTEVPRQSIFIGTTNNKRYLKDQTGNRRFWPVEIEQFDIERLTANRDQLWAEASAAEAEGASIRLDESLWAAAAEEQADRGILDPYTETLTVHLGDLEGKIRSEDVWTIIGLKSGQRHQEHNARLGEAMQTLGWKRKKLRFGGPPVHAYVKGDATHPQRIWVNRDRDDTVTVKLGSDDDEPM